MRYHYFFVYEVNMPVNINAKLNIAVSQQSVAPAITSIQNAFRGKKIPLEVELKIPKEIDREIYRANRAFEVLDKRMISLKIHAAEALFNVQLFVKNITKVGESLDAAISPAAKSLDKATVAVNNVSKSTSQAQKSASGLAEAIGASTKRFVSFAIAAGIIANVVFQLQKGFSAALQFDRELVRFKQVGGDSSAVIKDISNEVSKLSKGLGVSSNDLIKSAITLRQAGLNAKETKIALDALAKTTLSPTFDSLNNTTEAVIATLAQFKKGAGDLEKQLGSINRVSADYAVESGDLTEAIRRTGGAFVAAGGNLNELLALFTSVRATTRESAESIATAFRTIFARLQDPTIIKNLRGYGVELQNMEGRFVGPYEAVKRLNQAFAELPTGSSEFAAAVKEIGGIRQVSKVIPLIQQFPIAIKAYNTALEGQSSLSKDAAIAQEAFLNKIQKLKESMLDLFRTIVSNDAFGSLLNFLIGAAKAATDLVSAFKPLIPLLTVVSVFKFGNFIARSGTAFKSGFAQTRFASGGAVPSAPNSGIRIGTDTVPAILTEGEYVIKRSAAQKIGYDTLDQLNAYADGGIVSVNDRKKAAMLVMNRRSQDSSNNMTVVIPADKLNKAVREKLPEGATAVSGNFAVAGPSSNYQNTTLQQDFKDSIKDSIIRLTSRVFGIKVKKLDDSIYKNVIAPSGQGRLFEAALQAVAGSKIDSPTETFDFNKPIRGELANIFPGSQGRYGDAKLSQNTRSEISMLSKMIYRFGVKKKLSGDYHDLRKSHEKQLEGLSKEEKEKQRGVLGINVLPSSPPPFVGPPKPKGKKIKTFATGGAVGGKRTSNKIGVLQSLLDNFGIGLNAKNLVRKVYIGKTRKGERGLYNPQADSIFISKDLEDNIPSLLHELGHAIDYKFIEQKLGKRSNSKSVAYSSQNIPGFKRASELYKKNFINLPFSMTGGRGLNKYDPRSHDTESFANAFTAYGLFKGARAGKIDPLKYPQFESFVRKNPKDMVEIISLFEKLTPHLKDVKYLPINRKDLKSGRLEAANKLRDMRRSNKIGTYAAGGIVGSSKGRGRGIRVSGGGIAVFGGRRPQLYAGGSRGGVSRGINPKEEFDSKFIQEITTLSNKIDNIRNQIPLAPHYGLGLNSNLPPIPIDRDTPPPISLSSQNYSGIPLSNAPSRGIQSNLPPIKLDQDISGIPLTTSADRIRSSYLDAKRSGRAAAREYFGGGLSGMSGTIELGSAPQETKADKNINNTTKTKKIVEDLGFSFSKLDNKITNLKDKSGNLVNVLTRNVDGLDKVIVQLSHDGRQLELISKKGYLGKGGRSKAISIGSGLARDEISAQQLQDLIDSGDFDVSNPTPKTKTKQGRFGKFFQEKGTVLGISAALTLPYLSQTAFGDAEKPGSFGTIGAKIGGAATAGAEGGFLGAQIGAAFGPQGAIIGGVIGALGSVVFSLKQFDEELKRVNTEKISKSFSNLDIDAKTGAIGNKVAFANIQESLKNVKGGDIFFDEDKFKAESDKFIKDGFVNVNELKKLNRAYDNAAKEVGQFSNELVSLAKADLQANPSKDISAAGPKINGISIAETLKRSGKTSELAELTEFQKQIKRSSDITSKINSLQEQAFLSLKDLNTAMEIFSNTVEQAGDKFQKNAAFNAVGSEALAGKVSAGSSGPSIGLFNQFGKDIETFAKPGGQLDESRKYISEAIRFGLKSQRRLNLDTVDPDQIDQSASEAGKSFLEKSGINNSFGINIANAIKDVLSSSLGNTSKIPEGLELAKLTEDVVGRFKNIQGFRNNTNKQLESAFGAYSQQVGSLAERRGAILQRGAEISNRAEEFGLANLQTREAASGSLTRFVPGGTISSQEVLAQKEISSRQAQVKNQLSALGIDSKDSKFRQALGQGELPTGNELKARLQQAQSQLGTAQSQQKNATNINEYQAATKKIVELTFTISNLKKGMDLLANSTSVLDAKNKALNVALDQQKQDLEGRRSDAEILTFGTAEEKQRLAYKEQLTQTALQNPNALQFANDEEKQLIRERLRESNITRSFQEYDKFGRERGVGFINSQQQLEGLTNPIYQQLLRTPGAQYNRNRVGKAQAGVEAEQNLLNANAKVNNNVDFNDVKEQRRLMDQNFNEYIKNINDGLTKNAATFDHFADSVEKFGQYVEMIPEKITLQSTNDHNVNVVGVDNASRGIRRAVEKEAFTAFLRWARENKVLTEDSVA